MHQSVKTEERKQWCFIHVKIVTKMTEEICNTSCYQIWSTNNHHYYQKRRNITHQLFSSSTNKLYHPHKIEETPTILLFPGRNKKMAGVNPYLLIATYTKTDTWSELTTKLKTRTNGLKFLVIRPGSNFSWTTFRA